MIRLNHVSKIYGDGSKFITGEEAEDLLSVCAQERQEIRWKWAAENIS